MKLQALKDDIDTTSKLIWSQNQNIKLDRASKKSWKIAGIVTAVVAAAIAAPLIVLAAPPIAFMFLALAPLVGAGTQSIAEESQDFHHMLDSTPELNNYFKEADAQKSFADKMLTDLVKNTSIEKMSGSPQFDAAYKSCQQLRDRFTAAAAAKAAHGGDAPQVQTTIQQAKKVAGPIRG